MQNAPPGIFKQKPTTGEKKSDETTRAAQQILNDEKSAREAKTERLRLARLAQEAVPPAIVAAKPKPRATKRKAKG